MNENYAGRASISPILDLFVSMLEMGSEGYSKEIKLRKQNYLRLKTELEKWALQNGEKIVANVRNRISLALTLKHIGKEHAKELGARLYRKGVMGARVCVQSYPNSKSQPIGESESGNQEVKEETEKAQNKSGNENQKMKATQIQIQNQESQIMKDEIEEETNVKVFNNGALRLRNFGGHVGDSGYPAFPYITVAAAIGCEWGELETFIRRFDSVYQKLKKEISGKQEA